MASSDPSQRQSLEVLSTDVKVLEKFFTRSVPLPILMSQGPYFWVVLCGALH